MLRHWRRRGIPPEALDPAALPVEAPFTLRRRGVEGRLIVGNRAPQPHPDRALIRALTRAHSWLAELRHGKPLGEIAAATSVPTASSPVLAVRQKKAADR